MLKASPLIAQVSCPLVAAAAYAVGLAVAHLLIHASAAGAVFFPGAGITLAFLVLNPRSRWPVLLSAVGTTEFIVDVLLGYDIAPALGFALANTVEPLVGALLIRAGDRSAASPGGPGVPILDLRRRDHLLRFVTGGVLIGPVFGGAIGGAVIARETGTDWIQAALPFWAGDAMGALTVGGMLIAIATIGARSVVPLALAGVAGTALVTAVAFVPDVPVAYLPLLLLIRLALNRNLVVFSSAALALTLTANVMTAYGFGPWAALADNPNLEVATLQFFLAVALLTSWLLATEVYARVEEAAKYEREHASALGMQRALLPPSAQRLPGVRSQAVYRPGDDHNAVGGDWYDVFETGSGHTGLVVGDIVGHDLAAAVGMSRMLTATRVVGCQPRQGPVGVLTELDRQCWWLPATMAATIVYADFDSRAGLLRYASAGHPPPVFADADGAVFLQGGRSAPIGVAAGPPRVAAERRVKGPGWLVLYSDGLVERRDVGLGEALAALLRVVERIEKENMTDPAGACEYIINEMSGYLSDDDDVVVLAARLLPDARGDEDEELSRSEAAPARSA
ncbi:MAG: PP2C family protein-serine/threonine phosphatase [Nocardioides sp.]